MRNQDARPFRRRRTLLSLALIAALPLCAAPSAPPPDRPHLRRLLDNAFAYLDPAHGIVDRASGYPVEGWNQAPEQGLFLRSFTQLTAIGAWVELLATIAAGQADNPYLSRNAALDALARALASLLADQRDPGLADRGLLVNFLALDAGRRQGPLQETIEKQRFLDTLGAAEGAAIWQALVERGWLQAEDRGRRGRIRRGADYGFNHFTGALAPHADETRRGAIMELLDRRAITIIFGDNANLAASLARAAGALLHPELRHDQRAARLREQIEYFIASQRAGYAHLFRPETGTLAFGWDATAQRFVGWDDGQGQWVTGEMNALINEFRGPWTFVVLRHDLPLAALRNAGFTIRHYRLAAGRETHVLTAWDGSAFQLLGLLPFMQEQRNPAWRYQLATLVDIALDHATRHDLPGLLSEAYSGQGTEYTGAIGIPELASAGHALNTRSPSLYALGAAATLAPERVEDFLRTHWSRIARLFTAHGPWEGWDTAADRIIPYQTTAHTLSLILGGLGTAPDNMRRYLEANRLDGRLAALYAPGDAVNFLDDRAVIGAWGTEAPRIDRLPDRQGYRFAAPRLTGGGIEFRLAADRPVSLSNGRLRLRYRSETALPEVVIGFRRPDDDPLPPPTLPVEVVTRLEPGTDAELDIVLPATPALRDLAGLTLTVRNNTNPGPVALILAACEFVPFATALD